MSRKNAPASLFVVLVLFNICSGFRWASKLKKENAEYVHITLQPGSERTRRSVGMPDDLHFRFSMADKDMEVRLRRSVTKKDSKQDVTTSNFPLFVIENGTISREPLPPVQTAAIYENDTLGQLFVVRRNHELGGYLLEGVFYDAALNPYHLIPDQHGYHWIHKQDMVVDFRGDYIDNTVQGSNKSSSTSDSPTTSSHRRKRHTKFSKILGMSQNFVDRQLRAAVSNKGDNYHERNERAKRQAVSHYEIELFMVADFRDYIEWLSYYNGNATQTALEMHIFYSFVANWISQRYRSIPNVDPNLKIDILTTGLLIVKSQRDSYWTEENLHVIHTKSGRALSVEAGRALEAFRRWIDVRPDSLPDSDHWMLFTGFDIYTLNGDETNIHVAGLAKLGGLCTYNSVSIIEQDNTASVGATAAHELGHSLSARHDGELKGCRDEDNYIMSRKLKTPDVENLASRPWQFSPCSVRAFRHFLSRMKCGQIERHGTNFLTTELQGGQVFSADLQCQLALGKYSYFGRRVHHVDRYQSMCRRMFCAVPLPDADGYFQAIFAMEKTTCGDGKWCVQGKCTPDINAPRALDNCPQGDSPNFRCRRHYCHLYQPHHRDILCCKTCQERPPVNNFIYSLANSPVQIETVTRRVPAIPDFEPPPTTTTTTTTTTTRPSTTTIAQTSPLPSTAAPSPEPTTNRTTTPSVTSDTSPMTSPTTSSSAVDSALAASSASTPASKPSVPDVTSSAVGSGAAQSSNSSSSQIPEDTTTASPLITAESVPVSTTSGKTYAQSTPLAKMVADVTSPLPDFVSTTSSGASGAATAASAGDVTARSIASLPAGNIEENAVFPSATGDTSTLSSQLGSSEHHLTTTPLSAVMTETSKTPLQSNGRSEGEQNSAVDSLQAQSFTAMSSHRNEIVAGKTMSSPQDSQHTEGTQGPATSDKDSPITTESTVNLQLVDGMNSKSASVQNVSFGDANNSSRNASDSVLQSGESATENNKDASSTKLHASSVTSSATKDTVDPLEQTMTSGNTSQTANGSPQQEALSSSKDVVTTPMPSIQLSPANGLVSSDTETASAPPHSADTSPVGTTPKSLRNGSPLPPASTEPSQSGTQSKKVEAPASSQTTASPPADKTATEETSSNLFPPKELIDQLLADASTFPLQSSAASDSSGGSLHQSDNSSSVTADSSLGRVDNSSVTGDSSLGRSDNSSVTEDGSLGRSNNSSATVDSSLGRSDNSSVTEDGSVSRSENSSLTGDSSLGRSVLDSSTVKPASTGTQQLLQDRQSTKQPSQSLPGTQSNGAIESSDSAGENNATTGQDLNGEGSPLFTVNGSDARNFQASDNLAGSPGSVQENNQTGSNISSPGSSYSDQTQDAYSLGNPSGANASEDSGNRTDSISNLTASLSVQNGSQTEPVLESSGFNSSPPMNNNSLTDSVLESSGYNASVLFHNGSQIDSILQSSGSNDSDSSNQTQSIASGDALPSFYASRLPSSSLRPMPRLGPSYLLRGQGTSMSGGSPDVSVQDLDTLSRPPPSISRFPNVPFIRFRTTSDRVTTWLPPTATAEDPAFLPTTETSANEPRRCYALCQLFRDPTLQSGNTFLDGMSRFFRSRMETTFDRLQHRPPRMRQVGDLYRLAPSGDRVTPVSRMDYLFPRRRRVRRRREG